MRAGTLLFLPFFAAVSNALVFTLSSTSLTAGAVTLTYASEASDPAGELSIWLSPVGSNARPFAAAAEVPPTKVGETATIQVDVSVEAADGDKWEFSAGPASSPTGLFAKSDPFTVTVAGAGAVDNAANSASASAQQSQSQSQSQSASAASSAQPSLSTASAPPSKSSASVDPTTSPSAPPTNSDSTTAPSTETTAPPLPDANAALPSSPSSVSSLQPSASASSVPKVGNALGASSKSSPPPVGTIVGAVVGGLVGILLVVFLVIAYLRKRAWRSRLEEDLEKYTSDRDGNMFAPTANEYGGEKDGAGAEGLSRAPSLGYGQGAAQAQMQNPYPYTTYGSGYAGGYNA